MIEQIDTEQALYLFAAEIEGRIGTAISSGKIIRDVFGKLSFLAPADLDQDARCELAQPFSFVLSGFLDDREPVVFADDAFGQSILSENGQMFERLSVPFRVLDRRLAGDDWLQMPQPHKTSPARIAFYGLKGGVGRSTALAVTAADLAQSGKNVLVVDLDLEAPGLGSILLREDQNPQFGVLDWFSLGAIGIDVSVIASDMLGGSPFTTGSGVVDVVPASGLSTDRNPTGFFSKLARAYTPGAQSGRLVDKTFTEKVEIMLSDLLEYRSYDVVLLDVRAGLNETSAASLLGLGATVLLFGVASTQTISDYRILLSSIRQSLTSWPEAADIRGQFRMVQGKASSAPAEQALYRAQTWQLWLDTLYDAVSEEPDADAYSFDLDDPQGPHFPWVIGNSEQFLSFDPQTSQEHLSEQLYQPAFGGFIANVRKLIDERVID